jgi:hypothetical protein
MLLFLAGEAQAVLGGAQQATRARRREGTPRHHCRPGWGRPPLPPRLGEAAAAHLPDNTATNACWEP